MSIDLSGLKADLKDLEPREACRVQTLVSQHPEAEDTLREAIASAYSADALERVFKARGLPISSTTIRRHRRGECAVCAKAKAGA